MPLPLWARALSWLCHPLAIIPVAVVIGRVAGHDPVDQPQSARHGVMVAWHQLCDALLGDVGRHP